MTTQQQLLSLQNFLNGQVRIAGTVEEPWFVAKDVAKILGISNSSDMA
jgi:prophage antirepressor-like protein